MGSSMVFLTWPSVDTESMRSAAVGSQLDGFVYARHGHELMG